MWTLLLALGLVAYNSRMNRWAAFSGPLYVPLNLLAAAGTMAIALGPLGLSAADIGLRAGPGDVAVGLALGMGLAVVLFVRPVEDRRVAHLSGPALAYQTLVRVPFGTAITEEVVFRGVLLAAARAEGVPNAPLVAAAAFGLWHVVPTVAMIDANRPHAGVPVRVALVLGAVMLTALAGLALSELRDQTGGLAAPMALHASLNSGATLAAVMGSRARSRLLRAAGRSS